MKMSRDGDYLLLSRHISTHNNNVVKNCGSLLHSSFYAAGPIPDFPVQAQTSKWPNCVTTTAAAATITRKSVKETESYCCRSSSETQSLPLEPLEVEGKKIHPKMIVLFHPFASLLPSFVAAISDRSLADLCYSLVSAFTINRQ